MSATTLHSGDVPLKGVMLIVAALTLAMANFIAVLDMTIANVSISHIAGTLAVSPTEGAWVITSYAVAEAIIVPLTGWIAQRFGVVKTFIVCMTLFGLGSMLCGFAWSLPSLVFFRKGRVVGRIDGLPTPQQLVQRIQALAA